MKLGIFGEEHGIMNQPKRSLMGSMKGDKILLATPLVKYYLQKGFKITKIYQVVEFTPDPCFHAFGLAVSDARSCKWWSDGMRTLAHGHYTSTQ